MLSIFTDTFFVFGFFVGIVLSFLIVFLMYEKIFRQKLEKIIQIYKQNLSNLKDEIENTQDKCCKKIEELAEYKKSDMQNIVNKLQETYESQSEEIEFKEEKLSNVVKKLDELYSNIANESENIKSNISELHRLREKHEKIVATNRQLNERLTKKKKQLESLKER